jgi:hypothetical protein
MRRDHNDLVRTVQPVRRKRGTRGEAELVSRTIDS